MGLLFASHDQRTASNVAINVDAPYTQGIQHGSGAVLVRDVEASLAALQTGLQIRQGRSELFFLSLIDNASMFV
jgi:hypothetical protein